MTTMNEIGDYLDDERERKQQMNNETKSLTWEQYKIEAAKFATYPKDEEKIYLVLGYFGEVGEMLQVRKKHLRGDKMDFQGKILSEVGDCFWYLATLTNMVRSQGGYWYLDITQEERSRMKNIDYLLTAFVPEKIIFQEERDKLDAICFHLGYAPETIYAENIAKLTDRLNRNVIQGSGDDR